MTNSLRRRIYQIVTIAEPGDRISQWFDYTLLALILANVLAVVIASVPAIGSEYTMLFRGIELVSVLLFSMEYLARVWSCVEIPSYVHPVWGRLRYLFTPLAVIDLLAILPFYLTFLSTDLRILRILRVFRLLRVFKFARYSKTLRIFSRVLVKTRVQLAFTLILMSTLLLLSASFMYAVEQEAQPETFSSIPAAMWWAIATLTTVGYGDVYPVTALGKVLASFIAVFGIGMFALPTGVLGAAFLEVIKSDRGTTCATNCPHCGKAIHETADDEP